MGIAVIDSEQLAAMIEDAVTRALDRREHSETCEWIDTDGAARMLSLHRDTVSRMARFGELPSHRIGRVYRFRRSEIEAWIQANRTP